jgi:carbamoyltransferase
MVILGISAFVHDSAACLIIDGRMVANVEEERLDRIKHTNVFPVRAIDYVLKQGQIRLGDVDLIAYNWNPYKSAVVEAVKLVTAPIIYCKVLKYARPPKNFRSIAASLRLKKTVNRFYPGEFRGRVICVNHHLAHAASSYYLAPFSRQDADIIVADGHGEDCATSVFSVKNSSFELQWKAPIWDSLGILYTTFTNFLGFDTYQEGKTMALASYGKDTFREQFQRIIELRPGGEYVIPNQKYLGLWYYSESGIGSEFGAKRERDEPLEQRHFDIAFSMQNRIKEVVLHMVRHFATVSGHENLCLSGGLFLNCDINREILQSGAYKRVFIPPFPSDSGGAAGAALYAAFVCCREATADLPGFSPYLGPEYSSDEILAALETRGVAYCKIDKPWQEAAEALAKEKIIGWFQGRMESGPRALGNRSILASPFSHGIREYLNSQVKKREYFRPFAPIATREAALRYFELEEPLSELTSYMLVTTEVRQEYRDVLPGITHVDGTARIQVVSRESNPELHRLLLEFEKLTGYAVLINTSFNLQEPIVCSPEDALNCFDRTPLDLLFMGYFMVSR